MLRRLSLAFVLAATACGVLSAQAIDKWTLRVYTQGAQAPLLAPTDLLAGAVICNQTPPTITTTPANPRRVAFDDVNNTGKVCIWTDPGTGPLFSVPFGGNYELTLTATNAAGTSPESVRAPFSRPGLPPSAPTGVRLTP